MPDKQTILTILDIYRKESEKLLEGYNPKWPQRYKDKYMNRITNAIIENQLTLRYIKEDIIETIKKNIREDILMSKKGY